LGWAVSLAIVWEMLYSKGDTSGLIIGGAIGGSVGGGVMAITLWRENILSTLKRGVWITSGWIIGWIIGWTIVAIVDNPTSLPIAGAIGGAVGGGVMANTLRRENKVSTPKEMLWIALGWSIVWGIGWMINFISGLSNNRVTVGAIIGAIGGAIGGYITFWQIKNVVNVPHRQQNHNFTRLNSINLIATNKKYFLSWWGRILLGGIVGTTLAFTSIRVLGNTDGIPLSIFVIVCSLAGLIMYPHKYSAAFLIIGFLSCGFLAVVSISVDPYSYSLAGYFSYFIIGGSYGILAGAILIRVLLWAKILK
jgi:hypothetical protein